MDVGSIKLGRQMQARQFLVSVTNADKVAIQGDSRRVALFISPPPTTEATVTFGSPAVDGQGIVVPPATQTMKLLIDEYGIMLTQDVHVISSALGPENVMLTDVILVES